MPLRVESLVSNLLLSYTHSGNKTVISGVMPQDSPGYPFESPQGEAANCCISILFLFLEVFRNRPFVSCMDGNSNCCDWDDDSYTAQKLSKFGISLAWYIFSFIVKTAVNNNVYLINVCRLKKEQTSHSIAVYSLIKLCNMQLRYYRKRHKNVYNKSLCVFWGVGLYDQDYC